MNKSEQIRQGLRRLAGEVGPVPTMLAIVKSVDAVNLTCVLEDEGFDYYDVRLRPVINGAEGITAIPVVGSYVLAARIEDDEEWCVIAYDEVSSYRIKASALEFEMSGGKFRIKKGSETLGKLMDDLFAAALAEKHTTPSGPSTGLVPTSVTQYNFLRNRFKDFLTLT